MVGRAQHLPCLEVLAPDLAGPRCKGRERFVAVMDQTLVIQRLQRHLGLPTDVPEPRPAPAPPRQLDVAVDLSEDDPECGATW